MQNDKIFVQPVHLCHEKWNYEIKQFDQEISWDPSLVEKCDDPKFWVFIIQDQNGITIHKENITYSEHPDIIDGNTTSKKFIFSYRSLIQKPTSLLIWPYSESNNWLSFNTQLLK
jgi:hypothetical protein